MSWDRLGQAMTIASEHCSMNLSFLDRMFEECLGKNQHFIDFFFFFTKYYFMATNPPNKSMLCLCYWMLITYLWGIHLSRVSSLSNNPLVSYSSLSTTAVFKFDQIHILKAMSFTKLWWLDVKAQTGGLKYKGLSTGINHNHVFCIRLHPPTVLIKWNYLISLLDSKPNKVDVKMFFFTGLNHPCEVKKYKHLTLTWESQAH